MEKTEIVQSCMAIEIDEVLKYRLAMTVQSKGELPHVYLFVFQIQNEDNPASDFFARVANVEDVQNGYQTRDAAIAAGSTEYLAQFVELFYQDINVAVSAKSTFSTRINGLINTWITYQDDFIDTDGQTLSYPTTDPGYEQSLKDAYVEARDVRIEAEAAVATADVQVETDKSVRSYEKQIYGVYQDTCALITKVWNPPAGELQTYRGKLSTEGTDAGDYWSTLESSMNNLKNAVCPKVSQQAGVVSSAEDAVSSALEAKEEASASLTAAQKAEDEALAAVLAVCPDFDPASV